jgi:hypothetical protein
MISDDLHAKFLRELDDNMSYLIRQDFLEHSEDNVKICIDRYCKITYGSELPVVWVTPNRNHGVEEFYSSEYNLTWLLSYVRYYGDYISELEGEKYEDLYDIYRRCLFMSLIMTMTEGINIVDNTVYVLGKDVDFVNYKIEKKLFI